MDATDPDAQDLNSPGRSGDDQPSAEGAMARDPASGAGSEPVPAPRMPGGDEPAADTPHAPDAGGEDAQRSIEFSVSQDAQTAADASEGVESAPPPAPAGPALGYERVAANGVHVDLFYDSHVNYAMQQNAVPVVQSIHVRNTGEAPLDDVRVTLWASPALAPRVTLDIGTLGVGEGRALEPVDVPFNADRLVNQNERERARLWLEVTAGDSVCYRHDAPIDVLAYAEWAGSQSLPEILAAFVLPNHPLMDRLLADALVHLQQSTGKKAFEGYETRDPEDVHAYLRAIYDALCDRELGYVKAPASFEAGGQKVRTPERLLETRLGTCLDLVLLGAAALEQAGLHPVLILQQGHALLAVWTHDESFPDPTTESALRVRKRIEVGHLAVLETTALTHRPGIRFEDAIRSATDRASKDDAFSFAVDVRAARRAGIRPLPHRELRATYIATQGGDGREPEGEGEGPGAVPPEAEGGPYVAVGAAAIEPVPPAGAGTAEDVSTGSDRLDRWKRKLLDLTLRNRMLNHRATKRTLELECPDVGRLEDRLAEGGSFKISPKATVMDESDPRDASLHQQRTGEDARATFLVEELDEGRLHARVDEEELLRRLVTIDRAARLSLEEGGANTLYLAIGFLDWLETPSATKPRTAPILLLPLEMTRTGVREGYRIALADDDPQINVTLLQKLEVDFELEIPGLDPLATDESGLDVPDILRRFREAILPLDGWEVREDAVVGLFSFTKHLMWRDLNARAGGLLEHPVVHHLVETPGEAWQSDATFPEARTLDADHAAADVLTPLDADSSQLRAILAAAAGHTFVLEGPPGTGKSQTIANLIAHALGQGQRVLFVSEKMAALGVVFRRLSRIGLGPFCLELHSNKARKRAVLEQLGEALNEESVAVRRFDERATELDGAQDRLGAYITALHEGHPAGLSVFGALDQLRLVSDAPRTAFVFDAGGLTETTRTAWREGIHGLEVALRGLGSPAAHPFSASRVTAWTPSLSEGVRAVGERLQRATRELDTESTELVRTLGLPALSLASGDLEALDACAVHALDPLPLTRTLLEAPSLGEQGFAARRARAEAWRDMGRDLEAREATLHASWSESIRELDSETLHARAVKAAGSWWPLSWWRARGVKKALRPLWSKGKLPGTAALVPELLQMRDAHALRTQLETLGGEAGPMLGETWRGADTAWSKLDAVLTRAAALRTAILRLAEASGKAREQAQTALRGAMLEAGDRFAEGTRARGYVEAFTSARDEFAAARAGASTTLVLDESLAFGDSDAPAFFERVGEMAGGWLEALRRLRDWTAWCRARETAEAVELGAFVRALDQGVLEAEHLRASHERAVLEAWVAHVVSGNETLSAFHRPVHEDQIDRFRTLDTEVRDAAAHVVRHRLVERLPGKRPALSSSSTSEVGLLLRELSKQRRHMPIRQLFRRIPNLLTRLKPCLLMSPLSVAQYLGPDSAPFDLVVFDEASQIPTWDAVGAIARGQRLVVVGDSKQLPPTTFFQRFDDEDLGNEDEVEELESILDECLAARMPSLRLAWHYRSRHESLIAFSNHRYYDGDLFTFPAAAFEAPELGVQWRHVPNGVYEKGASRTNRAEAEAVVAEIEHRLTAEPPDTRSIGVVTFSQAQQTLVMDLLDDLRARHPELESHFARSDEPVFVKNLENVQGDERDVILFSICYGPDEHGKVSLNFGPLNRDGGERRLNVAITRSREQVLVFSTLRADQIDLARTRALGVHHLRYFLHYAEHGPASLLAVGEGARVESQASHLEEALRDELVAKGLDVDLRVGASGYRVDLGVRDPDDPTRYRLGIETDGPMYAGGSTARDRDRTRSAVLGSLGWNLHRVWSMDLWQDPEGEVRRIMDRWTQLAQEAAESAEAAKGAEAPGVAEEGAALEPPQDDAAGDDPSGNEPEGGGADHVAEGTASLGAVEPSRMPGAPYAVARFAGRRGGAEKFYEASTTPRLMELVAQVLEVEAPVSLRVLTRRIADRYQVERVTERTTERITTVLESVPHVRRELGEERVMLWQKDADPDAFTAWRAGLSGDEDEREVDDVAPEEIAAAAHHVLTGHIAMPRKDLCRETARLLGWPRLGSTVERCMDEGVAVLLGRGRVREEDERIVM